MVPCGKEADMGFWKAGDLHGNVKVAVVVNETCRERRLLANPGED